MGDFQNYLDNALKNLDVKNTKHTNDLPKIDYDIANDISDLLAKTRKDLGISQRQLAERTGIPQANISKIENGHYLPSLAILKKLADGLGRRLIVDFIDFESES